MCKTNDEDTLPDSTDLDGWRRAISEGRHTGYRLEAIVAAIQDLGPCTDKAVLNPLAKHLSDALLHILRKYVSVNHPNRGLDIIEKTHGQIIDALLQPTSTDGKALRVAFVPRVKFRLKDALVSAASAAQNRESLEVEFKAGHATRRGPDGERHAVSKQHETSRSLDEELDVETILETVTDYRKRLAFRLSMEKVPFKSKKSASPSIAEVLDISERTARKWVKEVQELLSSAPAAQELLQLKTRGTT